MFIPWNEQGNQSASAEKRWSWAEPKQRCSGGGGGGHIFLPYKILYSSTKHVRRRDLAPAGDKLKVSGYWMEINWDWRVDSSVFSLQQWIAESCFGPWGFPTQAVASDRAELSLPGPRRLELREEQQDLAHIRTPRSNSPMVHCPVTAPSITSHRSVIACSSWGNKGSKEESHGSLVSALLLVTVQMERISLHN